MGKQKQNIPPQLLNEILKDLKKLLKDFVKDKKLKPDPKEADFDSLVLLMQAALLKEYDDGVIIRNKGKPFRIVKAK